MSLFTYCTPYDQVRLLPSGLIVQKQRAAAPKGTTALSFEFFKEKHLSRVHCKAPLLSKV